MTGRQKLAGLCYLINAVACLFIGLGFVFGQEFFSFHSDVIQTAWQDLGPLEQKLYLGMMRTEGAGFLATFVAFAFLLFIPFRRGENWAYWAMTAIGLAEHLPTLIATFHVSQTTSASPPWPLTLSLVALLVAGLLLSLTNKKNISPA